MIATLPRAGYVRRDTEAVSCANDAAASCCVRVLVGLLPFVPVAYSSVDPRGDGAVAGRGAR